MTIYTFCGYDDNTAEIAKACLANYFGGSDSGIELRHRENGAPYLQGSTLNVSISHSANYFVLALSRQSVGVDVECIKERAFEAIARKFFDDEVADLRAFYEEWTKLEAQYKHGGCGGSFRSFDVFKDAVLTVCSQYKDIIFIPYESFKEVKK